MISLILSSFFWGYLLSQLVPSYFARVLGIKWTVFAFMGLATLATLLTAVAPWLSDVLQILMKRQVWPVNIFIQLRFLVGIGSGIFFPTVIAMCAAWAPATQRSTLVGICFSGMYFGVLLPSFHFPSSSLDKTIFSRKNMGY